MKNIFTVLGSVLFTVFVYLPGRQVNAQAPDKISYQAVVRNASNVLIQSSSIGMQISILQGSTSGTVVYSETHSTTSNINGLVTIEIGGGTPVTGTFTAIDWSTGPYFLKTETDPSGGTNYTVTGTSQLLSVPYALHAKTAETITGTINEVDPVFTAWDKTTGISITESQISDLGTYIETESDPVFGASVAGGITATDTTNWNNKLDSYTETDPQFTAWDKTTGISITESQISDLGTYIETETDPNVPTGTSPGQMQYWNGSEWVTVAAGNEGQVLTFVSGVPTWKTTVGPTDVYNPTTGKIWMDKNLGASQVATASDDADAYGDLCQWGRDTDGHEKRTSGTTSTLSSSDTPGHGNFITVGSSPYDWRSPQNDNLWQGVSGTNNPYPSLYRLPTEAEWEAERQSWSSNDAAGAFASPLKLPVAGGRYYSDGSLGNVGSFGYYWSSTVAGTRSRSLYFYNSGANMGSYYRAFGFSVRCLKD